MMQSSANATSHRILFLNTLAFTICFAAWMLNGVLVTFLSTNQIFHWGSVEMGWLLQNSCFNWLTFKTPAGMLTDKFGGKPVFAALLSPQCYSHVFTFNRDRLYFFRTLQFWLRFYGGEFLNWHCLFFNLVS